MEWAASLGNRATFAPARAEKEPQEQVGGSLSYGHTRSYAQTIVPANKHRRESFYTCFEETLLICNCEIFRSEKLQSNFNKSKIGNNISFGDIK